MTHRRVSTIVLAALWLAGVAAFAQEADEPSPPDNAVTETTGQVYYESAAGDFVVRFPSGCARLHERTPIEDWMENEESAPQMTIHVFCDRAERRGEGFSVTAYVDEDLDNGQPADPQFVVVRVEAVLAEYGVQIVKQKPYHVVVEDGPRMEGLDVLATDAEKLGQVWVRGLLVEGDVYLLVAWRVDGELAFDPEVVDFFDSFRAHTR